MALRTTTIGSYPKPDFVPVPDWFQAETTTLGNPTEAYDQFLRKAGPEADALLNRGTREVVAEQVAIGIDVATDGEIRRENYIHYHCRHLDGVDFRRLTAKSMRQGAWQGSVPTVTGAIRARRPFLVRDWQFAQAVSAKPVKMTLPGPLTLCDSLADEVYGDDRALAAAFADALNAEIRALAEAGCRWIQVDEPLFARRVEEALDFGMDALERCFHGISPDVKRCVHICCGYPDRVDSEDYLKAPPDSYLRLAPALDETAVDAVSIEDAHRPNPLELLEQFASTTVILGVVAIARSRVESVAQIEARGKAALQHIDSERLMLAPDCGLGMLSRAVAVAKLTHLVQAAQRLG